MSEATVENKPSVAPEDEEKLLKSEKIEQPSLEKIEPKTQEDRPSEEPSDKKDDEKEDRPKDERQREIGDESKTTLVEEKHENITSESAPCCPSESPEKIIRNQSDIFSLKDVATTLQTSIFSVSGAPSRRVFRKQEPAGHVFQKSDPSAATSSSPEQEPAAKPRITRENYNDEKRPSSSYRNPITGTGLSSNDEYKRKGVKRRDGNPLLGSGYDSEIQPSQSQHRIPPGGYAHKLW